MGRFLILIGILISTSIFACKCDGMGAIGIQFHNADFVGEIEILKVYEENQKNRTYKADIKIEKIYKGKPVNTIEVLGFPNDIQSSACEVELKVGEKYLIYLSKNNGDDIISYSSNRESGISISEKYLVSSCTPKTFIFGNENKKLNIERLVNEFLMKNDIHLSQSFFFDNSISESTQGDLKNYMIVNPKNSFAIFKLKVNGKSEVKEITAIQNFGSQQDEEIMKLIKKNFIIAKDMMTEVRNEEVLLTLFYLPENKDLEFKDTISLILE